MRALRLLEWNSAPRIVEVEEPTPGPGEVVVRVGGAGACHSDLHLMHHFARGAPPWRPPFTLGHENAGWVHEVGQGVAHLEVGQAVAVYGPWGCGTCARCQLGTETYCENLPGGASPWRRGRPRSRRRYGGADAGPVEPTPACPAQRARPGARRAPHRCWPHPLPCGTSVALQADTRHDGSSDRRRRSGPPGHPNPQGHHGSQSRGGGHPPRGFGPRAGVRCRSDRAKRRWGQRARSATPPAGVAPTWCWT